MMRFWKSFRDYFGFSLLLLMLVPFHDEKHFFGGNRQTTFTIVSGQQHLPQPTPQQYHSRKESTTNQNTNRIVQENLLIGNPSSEWDINGAGDPTIQGFATSISVNIDEQINFKIHCIGVCKYRADIYRLGYYGGMGARRMDTIRPVKSNNLDSHEQPDCNYDPNTHEVNCDNWKVSLAWRVPSNATSGLYFARLVREDDEESTFQNGNWRMDNADPNMWDLRFSRPKEDQDPRLPPPIGGKHAYGASKKRSSRMRNALKEPRASHVYFVVRDDHGPQADILIQTMDTTWQAYNCWGSLDTYGTACDDPYRDAGSPQYPKRERRKTEEDRTQNGSRTDQQQQPARAHRASYNRPFATRARRAANMPFNAEYPLIRWIERNGYDVIYWSGVDTHRLGHRLVASSTNIPPCKLFISQSHDEYWSKEQRLHVTAARDNGMHLAFLSGNEIFWKIRWENNFRTMVVCKDSQETKQIDPVEWTGTWRDDRPINTFGAKPENELTGTLFTVNAWRHDALEIPSKYANHRFWRHTHIARLKAGSDAKAVLLSGLLGHEWDEDIDNGFRPAGLQHLSETTIDNVVYLMDEGSVYDSGSATHHLVMYRHPISQALVFGAGTCQWAWGLDNEHDTATGIPPERSNTYNIRVGKDQSGPDIAIQQATVNLFADMLIFGATLQSNLVNSTTSIDSDPPTSKVVECKIISAKNEGNIASKRNDEESLVCVGIASDVESTGGCIAAVEVAIAKTPSPLYENLIWHPAHIDVVNATTAFTYAIAKSTLEADLVDFPNLYAFSRAVDDSGNLQQVLAGPWPLENIPKKLIPFDEL